MRNDDRSVGGAAADRVPTNGTFSHAVQQCDVGTPFAFRSACMLEVERLAEKVACSSSTVLLTGESGTGKGLLARRIHLAGDRRDEPFIAVNCSAIPEPLLESEFFGHAKGAFTGADRARKGLFLEADRGTLFLDEIAELPLHVQSKLLNAIEEKEIRSVGSERSRRVDVRIIAASNRDLRELVRAGRFRQDLFFRLSIFHIELPPLRKRKDDIARLIEFFIARHRAAHSASRVVGIEPDVLRSLLAYKWPGNVRELESTIDRACIVAETPHIDACDIPLEILGYATREAPPPSTRRLNGDLRDRLWKLETEILLRALEDADGDRKVAAQMLGISLSSLYRKLEMRDRE